jgi:hypothetical protein
MVKQNITVGSTWWNKAAHLMMARKQRERERQRKGPMTSHPPLGYTF